MNRAQRIYALHRLFYSRKRPIPRKRIEKELECSRFLLGCIPWRRVVKITFVAGPF